MRKQKLLSLLLLLAISAYSQKKTIPATRTEAVPRIDGKLDDAAWQNAPIATDFIQNSPDVGQGASQKTKVRVIYDDEAIYVGAMLYDDPLLIRRQITARDEEQQKDLDYFSVFFDTYHDTQNGFQFLVTSSNVQTDARLSPNYVSEFFEYGDKTWDAIWDSKVNITDSGWVAEMKIPYISLRFSKEEVQSWGLQFLRFMRRRNESSFWSEVKPEVNGFVNQFGLLQEIKNIKPPLRLSFSPYVSTGYRSEPAVTGGFKNRWLGSGGMDIKYGINESFTLDATIIPDFGQVFSDNVVNNLTPYEVRFDENRPFFTEGTELFNKSGLFYSRRIGAAPSGYEAVQKMEEDNPDDIEIVKNPFRTQLYNAFKFSGRTAGKLGIGVFNAVSAPMNAVIRDKHTGEETETQTEPLANYNILVFDQALKGRSFVTLTNTNVIRNGNNRDANVTGLDFSFFDKKNQFNFRGAGQYSKIYGLNQYDGFSTRLQFGKISGKWRFAFQNVIRSDEFDPTDLGFLQTNNQQVNTFTFSYNQFTPTKKFINYRIGLQSNYTRLYKPNRFNVFTTEAYAFMIFKNFWDTRIALGYLPDQHDYFAFVEPFEFNKPYTYYARRPQYGYFSLTGSTDSRKKLYFDYEILLSEFFKNKEKKYHILKGGVRYRFSKKWTMELSHRHEAETDYIFFVGNDAQGKPLIAFVDFKDVTSILSGIYNFTPRINFTMRLRHYWSYVPVDRITRVDEKGNEVTPPVIEPDNLINNINFFNLDAFFTWDFRYGSRLIFGYKNWLGDYLEVNGISHKNYFKNLGQSFDYRHGNELTVRFIYFLDYNQLKKKRK